MVARVYATGCGTHGHRPAQLAHNSGHSDIDNVERRLSGLRRPRRTTTGLFGAAAEATLELTAQDTAGLTPDAVLTLAHLSADPAPRATADDVGTTPVPPAGRIERSWHRPYWRRTDLRPAGIP
jgi:hypothetical protein